MENKKIKSVKRNGHIYNKCLGTQIWQSKATFGGSLNEWVTEDVILNCALFEIEYEDTIPFDPEIEELKKQLKYWIKGLEKIAAGNSETDRMN